MCVCVCERAMNMKHCDELGSLQLKRFVNAVHSSRLKVAISEAEGGDIVEFAGRKHLTMIESVDECKQQQADT